MLPIPDSVRLLAEDANAYAPLREGDRRVVTPRYVLGLRSTPGPRSALVSHLRLGVGEAAAVVGEIRALLREQGRHQAYWEVDSTATPATLADELLALGLIPAGPPFTATQAMILPGVPPHTGELPADVRITPVTTLEDYRHSCELFWTSFDFKPSPADRAALGTQFESFRRDPVSRRYLAWHGTEVVASASASLTPEAIILHGSATLPAWRGRGIYRALIWARWQEALRRGTPYLVTQAGSLSAPVLTKVGFVATAQIKNFTDSFAA